MVPVHCSTRKFLIDCRNLTGEGDMLLVAIRTIARARGMTDLAKASGLGRESLYKALSPGAKPRYETITKLLRALGVKLTVEPSHSSVQPV